MPARSRNGRPSISSRINCSQMFPILPNLGKGQISNRLNLPVQTVEATPSGIKLFSKVVFMKQGKRFGLSAEQKSDVWRRWKSGQTLHEIGRAFGKEHSSIRCLVSRHGGIAPAVRRRALLALTLREREEISRGLASGASNREIAKCLERAVSTVSREVARHGGRPAYRASQANGEAWQSALRPKRGLLSIHLKLRNIVASKLILDWSPKQISGWLKTQYPDDECMRGSNENTNGLLRQYFPKNADLTDYSQSALNKVALRLNQRPRQTLGFQTPASKLQESLASTY